MKKERLNIHTIICNDTEYAIKYLSKNSTTIPESCVIFENGMCIDAPFAGHSIAFALGSNIYFAEEGIDGPRGTSNELYQTLKRYNQDGIIDLSFSKALDSNDHDLFVRSIFGYGSVKNDLEDERHADIRDVYKSILGNTMWLGSKYNHSNPNELITKIAENWLVENGEILWVYRVMNSIFSDDHFFDEESHARWKHILSKYKIKLPNKSDIITSTNEHKLEILITDCFEMENFNQYQDTFSQASRIMSILGHKTTSNFEAVMITDFDQYLCRFMDDTLTPHQERQYNKLKEIQSGHITAMFIDHRLNIDFPLTKNTLKSIHRKDSSGYLSIDAIVPAETPLLRYTTIQESVITGLSIDDDVYIRPDRK